MYAENMIGHVRILIKLLDGFIWQMTSDFLPKFSPTKLSHYTVIQKTATGLIFSLFNVASPKRCLLATQYVFFMDLLASSFVFFAESEKC